MKKHIWIYAVMGVALAAAVLVAADRWAVAQQNEALLQDAFTQRALEGQEHLQAIALKMDKLGVTDDIATRVELLAGISRQADQAVSALAALPQSHAQTADTVKFLNQVSEYTLMLALKAASGQTWQPAELEQMQALRDQCVLLTGAAATSQWRSSAFYDEPADADNGMDYPSMIYDGAFSDARHMGTPKALGMQQVTQEQALQIARDFVGADRVQSAQAAPSTGGALESWGVTLQLSDGTVLNADITKQGGQMLWMIPEHASFQPLLTLEECTQQAQQFLKSQGYGEMEPNHYQVYDGLAVINFVAVQDGVLLYPDLIKVQLRMDTGELVGIESNNYLMNHTQRESLSPTLSEAEAREKISPRLEVAAVRLCVIPYRSGECLCWEAAGQYDGSEYRVYIDAQTGEERQVLKMIDGIHGRMAA